ncbi:MAG: hypothetical protein AB7E24_20730 [Novosphingobium sp.]|uniref:hypothetical protein n=1 Tax=Novosphingobium indicum TaxID=462949 RepID=UPI001662D3B7|nr:hypothetical protein [Novosphingobium indicum]
MNAIERIEAALTRAEAASREAADLRQRHERLKSSVSRSLENLDTLIAGLRR